MYLAHLFPHPIIIFSGEPMAPTFKMPVPYSEITFMMLPNSLILIMLMTISSMNGFYNHYENQDFKIGGIA